MPWDQALDIILRANKLGYVVDIFEEVGRGNRRTVDALAELPEHELEGRQRGNRLGLRILCELGRRYPGIVQATGPVRRKSA